jgi:hypothetical protein
LTQRPDDPLTPAGASDMLLGMTASINDLPDDIEQLKAMLLAERREKARLASHNEDDVRFVSHN